MKRYIAILVALVAMATGTKLMAAEIEAYAVYTSNDGTLTFYYDSNRSTRTGVVYDLNNDTETPEWYNNHTTWNIKNVVFHSSFKDARPTTTYYWFRGMFYLETISGLENLSTDEVTNMNSMFHGCNSIKNLDLSHFNTSKVTDMFSMFDSCLSLTSLDLSGWDTSNVTDMGEMFLMFEDYENNLTSLNLSGWDTRRVTNMSGMFHHCNKLTSLHLSGWNTANVTNMTRMFSDCSSLTSLDLSGWNTANVTSLGAMFQGCSSLTSLDLSGWNTANVTSLGAMFDGCSSLTSLDLSGWNTAKVTKLAAMFQGCSSLTSLHLNGWNTANVTDMHAMFDGCSGLTSLHLNGWNTANVTDMSSMFNSCSGLTSLHLNGWNTANVTDMFYMFLRCSSLTSLDLSGWDTGKVKTMTSMFSGCSNLETVYVGSKWSTERLLTYNQADSYLFSNCTKIKGERGTTYHADHIDADYAHVDGGSSNPGYFTRGVETYAMYDNGVLTFCHDNQRTVCTGTTYDVTRGEQAWIDVRASVTKVIIDESFQTVRPTTTFSWFRGMANLTEIEGLQYLNTSQVDDMRNMFYQCAKLTSLDLSSFDTKNVTGMAFMFRDCSQLTTIYASEGWNTDKVKTSSTMFTNCTALVGGEGTAYNSNHTGLDYARIDGGPSSPGYLTYKKAPDGIATSLGTIDNRQLTIDSSLPMYNLHGQRVSHPIKGQIYIQNGKKVLMK